MLKYPRTPHLEGSRWQPGDEELEGVPYETLVGKPLVFEEKLDGANAGLSFDSEGELRLQSRGHYLTGGERERHFHLFKSWAGCHQGALRERLGDRYQLYGEWLYAKHTIFYDCLPHYFLEFDVYDRAAQEFLSTPRRRELLAGLPVVSVPVLWEGVAPARPALLDWIRASLYKSAESAVRLREVARREGLDAERCERETDPSPLCEGLYVKHEENGRVVGRYKFIRASFLISVLDSESHWLTRPILPNQLAPGVDLFAC